MSSYFIRRESQVTGPFSACKVAEFFRAKQVKANDEVAASQTGPWKRLASVYRMILDEAEAALSSTERVKIEADASPEINSRTANVQLPGTGKTVREQASRQSTAEGNAKRLTTCSKCGGILSLRARKCPHCGASVASRHDYTSSVFNSREITEKQTSRSIRGVTRPGNNRNRRRSVSPEAARRAASGRYLATLSGLIVFGALILWGTVLLFRTPDSDEPALERKELASSERMAGLPGLTDPHQQNAAAEQVTSHPGLLSLEDVSRFLGIDADKSPIEPIASVEPEPPSATELNCRGLAHLRSGELDLALDVFSEAIDLSPALPYLLANRSVVYFRLAQDGINPAENHDSAIADIDKAIALAPASAAWRQCRGKMHALMGKSAAAVDDFIAAESLQPSRTSLDDNFTEFGDCLSPDRTTTNSDKAGGPLTGDALKQHAQLRESLLVALAGTQSHRLTSILNAIDSETAVAKPLWEDIKQLMKRKPRTRRVQEQLDGLYDDYECSGELLRELSTQHDILIDTFMQEQRSIITQLPVPGDEKLIHHNGRWLTTYELAELEDKASLPAQLSPANDDPDRRHRTGKALALWAWQQLAQTYSFKVQFENVLSVRLSRVRFVNAKLPAVYSLAPARSSVELQSLPYAGDDDDSYKFIVQYTNGLGQIVQAAGYVEVRYDKDDRAYLLGLSAPFLDTPRNGQLSPSRSSGDDALRRAFGR